MGTTVLVLLLGSGSSTADVPTARQDCEVRNLARCEFPSGVESSQPGPCPPGSRTLRPPGREDCDADRALPQPGAAVAAPAGEQPVSRGRDEPARVAGVERWLIPALIYSGLGAVALLIVWRWRRGNVAARSAATRTAVAALISAGVAALAGWKAAAAAFSATFNAYDNHDTAAPALIAGPVWLGTFVLVTMAVFAILMFACRRLDAARQR